MYEEIVRELPAIFTTVSTQPSLIPRPRGIKPQAREPGYTQPKLMGVYEYILEKI